MPDDPLYETLLSLIFAARERIWVVTPYFVPDEMLARALNLAARRGVDVRLIVPARSNHLSADLARESYLRELHEAGGQVFLYQSTMLHAKAVLFDDQLAVIGSANMDNRSLFLNYEVAVFLYSRGQTTRSRPGRSGLQSDCLRELPRPGWAASWPRTWSGCSLPCCDPPDAGRRDGLIRPRPPLLGQPLADGRGCAGRGRCGWGTTP